MPVEHIYNARECFLWICIAHVVEGTEGRNTYPNATRIPDVQDGLDDLTEKTRPVGSAAAVSVGADVRFRPKELVNQVPGQVGEAYSITVTLALGLPKVWSVGSGS